MFYFKIIFKHIYFIWNTGSCNSESLKWKGAAVINFVFSEDNSVSIQVH